MKKTFIILVTFLAGSLYHIPQLYAQDTQKEKQAKEMNKEDGENEDDIQKDENATTKKNKHVILKVRFGLEAGVNLANQNWKGYQTSYNNKMETGGRFGLLFDIPLSNHFYAQPGVFYAMNGTKVDATSSGIEKSSATYNFNAIELPVVILYKTGHPGGNRVFFGAGPYMGYIVSGKVKHTDNVTSLDGTLKFGSDVTSDDYAALDYGVTANVGFESTLGLYIKGGYQHGFANLILDAAPDTYIHANNYSIQIGYLFGKRAKRTKTKENINMEMQM